MPTARAPIGPQEKNPGWIHLPTPPQDGAEKRSNPEGDSDDRVRMCADGPVGGLDAFDRAVLDANPSLLAYVERLGKAFARFDNFLLGNINRGSQERLRVFSQAFEIWSVKSVGVAFHMLFFI
jgi:hypothetical protein